MTFVAFIFFGAAQAEEVATQKEKDVVEVRFDDASAPETEDKNFPQIDQIFKNPALLSSLSSGADAINKSIESLMEGLFYHLLDNEIKYPLKVDTWVSLSTQRDVYSADNGAYVVVDRIGLGPRFAKTLWKVQNLPINLGAEGTVDVLDIYLRTDGMRIAENAELPFWRQTINNWFGILPLLTGILPPSFNPNELYDPLRELETPFVLPMSIESFNAMPIGSIRSYGVSGGVHLGVELGELSDQVLRNTLDRLGGFAGNLPYTIFKQGEHRISVLRRTPNVAWVGLSRSDRFGHALEGLIGKSLIVLTGVLPLWAGMPANVFPVDMRIELATGQKFDQLFEYDLENAKAQQAYLAAVRGDFTTSKQMAIQQREKTEKTGVVFHFTRTQDIKEQNTGNSRNFAVARTTRKQERSSAEIEIVDQEGKFHVLETKQDVQDEDWDIFVGPQDTKYRDQVDMKVVKIMRPETEEKNEDHKKDKGEKAENVGWGNNRYVFAVASNPIRMTTTMSIQDRYTDAKELTKYVEALRFFSSLPLDDLPEISLREDDDEVKRRREIFYRNPKENIMQLHVTPTYLGRFGADATTSFSTEVLNSIGEKSDNELWRAFAKTFGFDPEEWGSDINRQSFFHQSRWLSTAIFYPLRLFNVRLAWADAIHESEKAIAAIHEMHEAKIPLAKQAAFFKLFDSDYPQYLTHALLELAELDKVPRSVTLSTSPKGGNAPGAKEKFKTMNGRVFKSAANFPTTERYRIAQDKLNAFYPGSVRELRRKPQVGAVIVSSRRLPPGSLGSQDAATEGELLDPLKKHLFLRLKLKNLDAERNARVFVRLEQSGKIQFGKLVLAEQVLELAPAPRIEKTVAGLDELVYESFLSGPLSPIRNFILDQAIDLGGEFKLTLAVSRDGIIWSDEKNIKFRFENGLLQPPQQ